MNVKKLHFHTKRQHLDTLMKEYFTEDKETSPMASQGLDISLKSKATESKEQRSAEDAGSTEKAPPKRVFPRRRKRLAGDPAEGSEVGTENTIYERRPKIRIDSTHRSFKSLGRRQGDTLEVEPTQRPLAHSPVSPKPEELAKALLKVQRTQERKEKSVLESVREWFEEQVTQQQQIPESTTPDAQASPPRRRKSKAKPATLLPYQGTPVVHATPSEKAAKTARALRATPKQESSDVSSYWMCKAAFEASEIQTISFRELATMKVGIITILAQVKAQILREEVHPGKVRRSHGKSYEFVSFHSALLVPVVKYPFQTRRKAEILFILQYVICVQINVKLLFITEIE